MLSVLPKYTHKRTRRHPGGEIHSIPWLWWRSHRDMHVSQLIKKYTLCIWSFLSINYTVMKLKKQFAHPWVTDQQWQRGRRTRGFGGSSSEGNLCQVLTSELRAEWLLLPPTSPVTSGSPLPCLRNIWGELHHLLPQPPAALFLHWPAWSTPSAVGLPLPASTRFETMEKKAISAEETFSFSLFAPIIPIGKTHKKAP